MVALERHHDDADARPDPRVISQATPEAPSEDFGHETTRYLCAAAYTDAVFREAVLERGREKYRARAPEVGVDVGMVATHCRRAARSRAIRDLAICAPTAVLAFLIFVGLGREGGAPLAVILLCWLAATVITAVEAFGLDAAVRKGLTRAAFQRQTTRPDPERDAGNVVVYAGFSPFVGSGSNLGGWSFAVDLERGKQGVIAQTPRPFELTELNGRVREAFERLHIANLRLIGKLFVGGRAIRGDRRFLPEIHGRPVSRVEDGLVAEHAASPSKSVRHYLCVETVDWSGELAVTLFIRFQKLSSKLFVELSAFLLPPLKARYYDLDRVRPNLRFKDAVTILLVAIVKAPFLLLFAPLTSLGRLQTVMQQDAVERAQRKQIDEDLLFDYGAAQSVRELAAGGEWRVYFQKLDKEMHHKILQQQLLDALVDFLDEHGVDTSEIKDRTEHILNNGVIVSGGSVNAQSLAVGDGAQAKVAHAVRRTREKVGV